MSDFTVVCDQSDREFWLAQRRTGVCASDIPAILGLSPFASSLSVLTEKRGLRQDNGESELLRWGHIVERPMCEMFAADTGRKVELNGHLLRSNAVPWLLSTLDAQQWSDDHEGPGVCECKFALFTSDKWDGEVPEWVNCQIQGQLAVTGWHWGSALVLLDGFKLRYQDVDRDDDYILKYLIPSAGQWWKMFEAGELPGPDGSRASAEALKQLFPRDQGHTVDLDGSFIDLHLRRVELKKQAKDVEDGLRAIDNQFKAAIGDATFGALPNGVTYSLKTTDKGAYEMPATSYRSLRLVGGGKKK